MKLEYTTVTSTLWLLAVCAAGLAIGVTSVAGWTVLATLALLPPILMMQLQREPARSMSQRIQDAGR